MNVTETGHGDDRHSPQSQLLRCNPAPVSGEDLAVLVADDRVDKAQVLDAAWQAAQVDSSSVVWALDGWGRSFPTASCSIWLKCIGLLLNKEPN